VGLRDRNLARQGHAKRWRRPPTAGASSAIAATFPGFAACLEAFDRRLSEIEAAMRGDDHCRITADHGNDPTFKGFDHTREHAPIVAFGAGAAPGPIGARRFARRHRRRRSRRARAA
jgi:hypothetical protein